MEYRHPVQGWTMALPVEDTAAPPEVFYVRGARLERADLAPTPRAAAIVATVARVLQRQEEAPLVWEAMSPWERQPFLDRATEVVDALTDAGAMAS